MNVSTLKHTEVLLDLCSKQKTVTTSRLAKEVKRLDSQARVKLSKQRDKYEHTIASLNKRAQIAEHKAEIMAKELKELREQAKKGRVSK